MTEPHLGPDQGSSRLSMLVAVLLALALMTAVLAVALGTGILQFRPPGDGQAVVSPSPTVLPTEPPIGSPEPTDEPTGEPTLAPEPTITLEPEPTERPSPGGIHVVQSGESLFSIGLLYGVPWTEIAAANEIENPDLLVVGQELIIPIPASFSPPPNVHIVQSGESIFSIAELYDVSPTDLAEANDLENWDLIFVGQQLLIPGIDPDESPAP